MGIVENTNAMISTVSGNTGRVILFYSGGKDSIALLNLMYPHFKEIICVFMYFVKDLEHINIFLRDALIRYPNVQLVQVPHWGLTHIFRAGVLCPKHYVRAMTIKDIDEGMRIKYGVGYTFYGMKKNDSIHRRLMLNTYGHGGMLSGTNKVYPLADWSNKDVLRYIQINRLPSPIQYSTLSSNGVTFDINVLLYCRKNYPDDLKKIFNTFPLAERLLFEYDYGRRTNKVSNINSGSSAEVEY
jgi:sulfate adenylyltransferase subunit 2